MIIYILYIILSPVIWATLLISIIFNKKIRLRFFSYSKLFNQTIHDVNLTNKKIILFHAASNGELEQLKPFFRKINREKYYIVLTISSPSSINSINKNEVDSLCYQAFDFPWSTYKFFKKIKPEKYLVTRHDLWPNHIIIAKLLNVKSYLVNGNLPESSKRTWPIIKILYQFLFNKFDTIYTVSNQLRNRFKNFLKNKDNIKIVGDTRFDQIKYRKSYTLDYNFISKENKRTKSILFGSIENKDLPIIFDSLNELNEKIKVNHINLIFVPHEPEDKILLNLENQLKELKIESTRYSIIKNDMAKLNDTEALIVDCTGILADLYKYSSVSYIGCGFGKGVHNVAEPAIYGNTICFGPKFNILNEAIEMIEQNIAYLITNKDELSKVINMVFDDKILNQNSKKIKHYIKSKLNSTESIISEIF